MKYLLIFSLFFITTLPTQPAHSAIKKKAWTVMMYFSADNNLTSYMTSILKRVERAGSSENVNVIIQFDGNKPNDSKRLLLKINPSSNENKSVILEQNIEYDMGSADTLANFVKYSIEHYPSEKTILVMHGHGRGILNVPAKDGSFLSNTTTKTMSLMSLASSSDDSSESYMNEEDVSKALQNVIQNNNNGNKIDLFVYDSCLMGNFEVLYTMAPVAKQMIASEYSITVDTSNNLHSNKAIGIDLESMVEYIIKSPNSSVKQIGVHVLDQFHKSYFDYQHMANSEDQSIIKYQSTLASYDLSKIWKVYSLLDKISKNLMIKAQENPNLFVQLFISLSSLNSIHNLGYVDIGVLANKINTLTNDKHSRELITLLNDDTLLINNKKIININLQHIFSGVSIYFPNITVDHIYKKQTIPMLQFYKNLSFSANNSWDELISVYTSYIVKNNELIYIKVVEKMVFREKLIRFKPNGNNEYNEYYNFILGYIACIDFLEGNKTHLVFEYIEMLLSSKYHSENMHKHLKDMSLLVQDIKDPTYKIKSATNIKRINAYLE